nr:MAG TPA: hypothetical protein [Caudoviricetes sp.]
MNPSVYSILYGYSYNKSLDIYNPNYSFAIF